MSKVSLYRDRRLCVPVFLILLLLSTSICEDQNLLSQERHSLSASHGSPMGNGSGKNDRKISIKSKDFSNDPSLDKEEM